MSQARDTRPIISGIGLRLPGAANAAAMWSVMAAGQSTVTTVSDRGFDPALYYDPQPGRRGKSYTFAAGQLENLYHFDPALFSISPREAAEMDPQQRFMLMATWDAVEDAGLDISDLAGPRTGVFVGSSIVENLPPYYYDTARGGSTFNLGNTLAIIANRVSARFDFRGPSQVVDTACSSGLTALDLANRALCQDELDVAIVGGVHVIRAPGGFVGFSQARMLSPTGACHAFSADADGYVRSEAAVVVVLMRPDVAERHNARLRARLLATGVNTDGGATPLMVPSRTRQTELIAKVLASAGRDPEDLAFYEAHGTGTKVGDPTEAGSLGQAVATLRRTPLMIGSSKTNFGHTEPAAGLVGLVKAVLALEQHKFPASLNCRTPNPEIDFEALNLIVNTQLSPISDDQTVAGVNAFGFGGTNAAALIERVTRHSDRKAPSYRNSCKPAWLMLSAATPASLSVLAKSWATRLHGVDDRTGASLAAAAASRAELPVRLAVPLDDTAPAALRDGTGPALLSGKAALDRPRTVYLFSGNGAQTADMGRTSYMADPVYRARFDVVAKAFADQGAPGLIAFVTGSADLEDELLDPLVAQPMLVTCQLAQVASLKANGLSPDALTGHSLGELVALHLGGAYDLPALARITVTRSRAFRKLRGTGGMATLLLDAATAERLIAGLGECGLSIAAINGPRNVTVTGPHDALDRLSQARVSGKRVALVRLDVAVPYHSAILDPFETELTEALSDIPFQPLGMPVAGPAVGRMLRQREVKGDYLWKNTRNVVQFDAALRALAASGPAHLVEIGPRAILGAAIRDIARHDGLALAHSPASGSDLRATPDKQVAALWVAGVPVNRRKLAPEVGGPRPDIPCYPMDLAEYHTALSPDGFDAWGEAGARRLPGRRADRSLPVWTADFTPSHPAWLADHRVGRRQILPAAALFEIVLAAASEIWPETPLKMRDFNILRPAEVAGEGLCLQTRIDPETGAVRLDTRPRLAGGDWLPLARGRVMRSEHLPASRRKPTFKDLADSAPVYDALSARGLDYGPAFRRLSRAGLGSKARVSGVLEGGAPADNLVLDPTALDAAMHAAAILADQLPQMVKTPADLARSLATGAALVPVRAKTVVLARQGGAPQSFQMTLRSVRRRGFDVDLILFDVQGRTVAQLTGLEFATTRADLPSIPARRWTARQVRLRPPGQSLRPPRGWREPQAALRRLGLSASTSQSSARQALTKLTHALDEGRNPQPHLSDLLRHHPQCVDEARCLMAMRREASSPDVFRWSGRNRDDWSTAERILADILPRWQKSERCALLLLGLPPSPLVWQLLEDPRVDAITLAHPDPVAQASLSRSLPTVLAPLVRDPAEAGPFDLIIGTCPPTAVSDLEITCGALIVALENGEATARLAGDAKTSPVLPVSVSSNEPERLPIGLQACMNSSQNGPALRVLSDAPDASVTDALALALGEIRSILNGATDRATTLVYMGNQDAAHFDQMAAGLSASIRTAGNEAPAKRLHLIAVGPGVQPDWADVLVLSRDEPVVICRTTGIYAPRLLPLAKAQPRGSALALGHTGDVLDPLAWLPTKRRAPRKGEVEIRVAATGLNFRDAMLARGLLPESAVEKGASGGGLGMEVAGHVLRSGPDSPLQPGTLVAGFAADGFASHITQPESAFVALPAGLPPETGAGIPVAFVTAWDALVNVAGLRADETLLVHAGAGAVGLAAIQIARHLGARVIATASTPEKRALVLAAGAAAAFDSRSLSFVEGLEKATHGKGVDVALNSLAGEAMRATVGCLAPGGRFVELGKRDALEGGQIDLAPFLEGLSYHGYDLDRRLLTHADAVRQALTSVMQALSRADLWPLPVTLIPSRDIAGAINYMLSGEHMGKLVITAPSPTRRAAADLDLAGHWVIVGGSGSLGLALARALVQVGVAHVHIVSRGGAPLALGTPDALWATTSNAITFHPLDATDTPALTALLQRLTAGHGALAGVIHAAMLLRDRMLRDLDPAETAAVLQAKLGTAHALNTALRNLSAEPRRVLFLSSIAASLGNPGQSVYAAANAALEALAAIRRSEGLPADVLALGAVAATTAVSGNTPLKARLDRLKGLAPLPIAAAIREILTVLRAPNDVDHLFAPVDWSRLAPSLPGLSAPMFAALVSPDAAEGEQMGDLAERLSGLAWPAALALLQAETIAILAKVLRLSAEDIDPHRPFGKFGLDSLMSLELRLEIEARLGLDLTQLPMSADTTPARFAATLLQQLRPSHPGDANE